MALFGSRKSPAEEQERWRVLEMLRTTFRMSGRPLEEARVLEKEHAGITFEDALALGHQCRLILKSPDGRLWMAYGELTGRWAQEVNEHNDKLDRASEILRRRGISDASDLNKLIKEQLNSSRVAYYDQNAAKAYALSKYDSCLGAIGADGKRQWLVRDGLLQGNEKNVIRALFWLALMECGVPESPAEAYMQTNEAFWK
jgi:hypothetical protein